MQQRFGVEAYWNLIAQVVEYAVDAIPETYLNLDGRVVASIDEAAFLSQLYAAHQNTDNVELETRLVEGMLNRGPILCVAGGRGVGKTSLIRYTTHRLREISPRARAEVLDFKRLYDTHYFHDLDETGAVHWFRQVICEVLLSRLFPGDETRRFLAWALAGPPDASDAFEAAVLDDLHHLSQEVLNISLCPRSLKRRSRSEHLVRWFADNPGIYGVLYRDNARTLRASHVLLAALQLLPISRLTVVYDNVDRVPPRHQAVFLEAINDAHNALGGRVATLIAIRAENIRGLKPRAGEGGDLLNIMMPDAREYPSVLFPEATSLHVKNVLDKRLSFVREICSRERAATGEFDDALNLHRAVIGESIDAQIHRLANDNLRCMVSMYVAFERYLHTLRLRGLLSADEIVASKADTTGHLHTLFFHWLFQEGPAYGIELGGVPGFESVSKDAADLASALQPNYFLVACVLNQSEERRTVGLRPVAPEFRELFSQLQDLGFSLSEVRNALRSLCAVPGGAPRILEFYGTEIWSDALPADSADRLGLTIAGEEFITSTSTKVGYVLGQACTRRGEERHALFYMRPEERIVALYDYLVQTARGELRCLELVRTNLAARWGANWLTGYRCKFGVFGKLTVERISDSASRFYAPYFGNRPGAFHFLQDQIAELVGRVERGDTCNDEDFVRLSRGRERIDARLSSAP